MKVHSLKLEFVDNGYVSTTASAGTGNRSGPNQALVGKRVQSRLYLEASCLLWWVSQSEQV